MVAAPGGLRQRCASAPCAATAGPCASSGTAPRVHAQTVDLYCIEFSTAPPAGTLSSWAGTPNVQPLDPCHSSLAFMAFCDAATPAIGSTCVALELHDR